MRSIDSEEVTFGVPVVEEGPDDQMWSGSRRWEASCPRLGFRGEDELDFAVRPQVEFVQEDVRRGGHPGHGLQPDVPSRGPVYPR